MNSNDICYRRSEIKGGAVKKIVSKYVDKEDI